MEATAINHRFFLPDGNLFLMVENKTYKIHKYFLQQHSEVFRDMLTVPQPEGSVEGSSAEKPIVLSGTKSIDFDRLLAIFYPENFLDMDHSRLDEWASVLEMAIRFEIGSVLSLAAERLYPLASSALRIYFGQRHRSLRGWLGPSYLDLCKRMETLTIDEGILLGLDDVIKLSDLRQRIRSPGSVSRGDASIKSEVQELFL